MIRLSVISSHIQKDNTYAACAVFDSMTSKEYKQLVDGIKKLLEDLNKNA
jgi:putative heme iron utilization protein